MEQHDRYIIGLGIAIPVLAGFWSQLMGIGTQIDAFIDFFTVLALLGSVTFIYLARDLLGGEIARNLEITGLGLFLYVVIYWASYTWSSVGGPAWLGVQAPAWDVFFSTATLVTFGFIAYGFYRFWALGEG